jgi:uncharacterized membrane protein
MKLIQLSEISDFYPKLVIIKLIVVFFISIVFLNENVNKNKMLGLAFACIAIYLIGKNKKSLSI